MWPFNRKHRLPKGVVSPVRIRVRPKFGDRDLLIEILADHRADGFPKVAEILAIGLGSIRQTHPENLDSADVAFGTDNFISYWVYDRGAYEIDDDWGGLFIMAHGSNGAVLNDVERVLLASGKFVK